MNSQQYSYNEVKNKKQNDCHMCWVEKKSSQLAFCSKRSCRKAFCERCIRDNYDENYSIKKHYKPDCFICYVCQGRCKCTFCNGSVPEKFGKRYIKKFLKIEEKKPLKIKSIKKQSYTEDKAQEDDDEEEELFCYKGKSFSSKRGQEQVIDNQLQNKNHSEDSNSLENINVQPKIQFLEQDEETKSPSQFPSSFSYGQQCGSVSNSLQNQLNSESLATNGSFDQKYTLNRIIGVSANEWYEANDETMMNGEETQNLNSLQSVEYAPSNIHYSNITSYELNQKIKYEEDSMCQSTPLNFHKSESITTQPNVIEESDDSEEEGIQSYYSNNQKVVKRVICKYKKQNIQQCNNRSVNKSNFA